LPLSEKSIVAGIRSRAKRRAAVRVSIGDDCAALLIPPGQEALVTTDFSLEGVHFRREWHPPEVVGHRCLTRGLSDIAAMGGRPIAAFLSLALPRNLPQSWINRFYSGLLRQADAFQTTLAGGDIAQSPGGILADVVVVGSAPKGKAIPRSGARPSDRIYVTGQLGGSSAALRLLFSGRKLRPADFPQHFHPQPRVGVGKFLREKRLASAMIDISDGLSTDLAHLCTASNVAAEIAAAKLPLHPLTRTQTPETALHSALHGGEDYELLFTAPLSASVPRAIAGVPLTCIGEIHRAGRNRPLMTLIAPDGTRTPLEPGGWEHLR
jgi:thiamine-monophosphate kinase